MHQVPLSLCRFLNVVTQVLCDIGVVDEYWQKNRQVPQGLTSNHNQTQVALQHWTHTLEKALIYTGQIGIEVAKNPRNWGDVVIQINWSSNETVQKLLKVLIAYVWLESASQFSLQYSLENSKNYNTYYVRERCSSVFSLLFCGVIGKACPEFGVLLPQHKQANDIGCSQEPEDKATCVTVNFPVCGEINLLWIFDLVSLET